MNKHLKFHLFIIISISWIFHSNAQITLTHNSCEVVQTDIHSCTSSFIYWSRTFTLQEFGINSDEEFIIYTGQFAIVNTSWIPTGQFRIYAIDNDFPSTFSEAGLIGESQEVDLPWFIGDNPEIITIDFDTPIVVPAGTQRILVEVKKGIGGTGSPSSVAFIAGSTEDNDISWQRGCLTIPPGPNGFVTATQMGYPNSNFYINVTGNINNVNNPFTLNYINDCSETNKEFQLNNISNISSVVWDFGDPTSGTNNTSTLISPTHDFTSSGQYLITVTITPIVGATYIISETISVAEPPIAYPINNLHSCEDAFGLGISSSFDTSNVESQVLNGQNGVIVTYYDQNGNELPSPLPNPYTNTIPNSQVITVRVSDSNDLCCFTETSFNLTVDLLPNLNPLDDILACDNNEDGFTVFNLTNVPSDLINNQSNLNVELFDSNDNLISVSNYNNFANLSANQDYVIAIVTDTTTNCSSEITINLIIHENPVANQLQIIYGCDNNNDGISEYFDISNVEDQVLNGQAGMTVSYFDQSGNQLSNPLPNPFTNSNPFNELITVRVTDTNTTCYTETTLELQTVTQPNINQPDNLYECDQGNGYAEFNTTNIEQQLIGNQTGLIIQYYDSNNNPLPNPLPALFQNTESFSQTINIRVEDSSNPICYSETSFDLIINELPEINLEDEYFICDLEPSILLGVNLSFNSYNWFFEDGTLISDTNSAEIAEEGNYILTVTQMDNGVTCENSFDFNLIRSVLPEIQQVNYGELGNNYIEIIASGDGDFEYSINGINYQDSNYFSNIQGGIYTVFVRDKDGCGEDSDEVIIIDYLKFFTPNNDGYNDFWQIKGISEFPNSKILIFDRYGKLLTLLTSNDLGWNGLYNGKKMRSNDYWFRANLGDGQAFSGHFTLKR
jgi:gliding motility-associated-like protein